MPLSYIICETKLNMKNYFKKVLIFAATITFLYLIVNNLLIFPEGKMKISFVMDTPTVIIFNRQLVIFISICGLN